MASSGFQATPHLMLYVLHEPATDKVRRLFELMPEVQHAGLVPATDGWEWYNFFWTRGAYARRAAGEPPSCT